MVTAKIQQTVPKIQQTLHRIVAFIAGWFPRNSRKDRDHALEEVSARDPAKLRSLSPAYVPEQHFEYVEILKRELIRSGLDAPRNLALTGHYGSGKSSVLGETQRVLVEDDIKVINLSIPSLGIGDGRIPTDGDEELEKTNLIQKEIVKQLLYRRKPSDMPASRYNRLDTFQVGRAMRGAVGVGLVATGTALLAQVPNKVRDALPPEAWTWTNTLWSHLAGTMQWLSLLIVFALTVWAAVWVQRILQQRIRVTELSAGPTKVTLTDSSSSYFDEYLDEIVYFFQTSKTAVVIFEDLDRFKDPHIFETLRELNMLLNHAEQTGAAPIRFVYAIRDSIFEQLDAEAEEDEAPGNDGRASSSDEGETRRLMATNRTKFFDLVVPMVPFISHRTSRDLIRQELEAIGEQQRPGKAVTNIVGAHVTDMRLIKNICNEYEVFRRRILTEGGLKELTADRLFSSIVYKNIYLADYEKIRDGTSRLDTLYSAYREWVTQQTAAARAAERSARARLRRIDPIGPRSPQLGARLQSVLLARTVQSVDTKSSQVVVGQVTYGWSDLVTVGFWGAYLENRGNLVVHYRAGYQGETLSFDKVRTLMGEELSPNAWTSEAEEDANRDIAQAVADHRSAQHASMTYAMGQSQRIFTYGGAERSVADVAEELFDEAVLVLELLREGLIDENFTLYVTQFPGQAISASAMNFIIKAVQPDSTDMEYHFGTGEEVNTDDIKAVLDEEADRLLGGQAIYNIELFDYLLAEDANKLDDPIRRLAATAEGDRSFLDAYITSGNSPRALIERLSGEWPGIFDFLLGLDAEIDIQVLLDAALSGVRPKLTYIVNEDQRNSLAQALPGLPSITKPQSAEKAVSIAETLLRMGIRISDLTVVAEPLRTELSKRSVYPITLTNLVTVMGDRAEISLDRIKDGRESDVYKHVVAHLRDYVSALEQAADLHTIADPDRFVDILLDVAKADVDILEDVARGASAGCMLGDLSQIDAPLWPALAAAQRLQLTARNVAAYIDEHDVDSDLASWLRVAGAINVGVDDSTPLVALAVNLLNAEGLRDTVKIQIVNSLGLDPGSVSVASLNEDARRILPSLVENGLVLDDAEAYRALGSDNWSTKADLISVSTEFPKYMTQLTLSMKDLFRLASGAVPDEVKDVLLKELETFAPMLGPKGATAIAVWASANGRVPTPDAIRLMAEKGDASCAQPIIKLLGAQASTMELDLIQSTLDALGVPYSHLSRPGRERPKIDAFVGMAAVLARLKKANIVSKFDENEKKGVFEVSKRYS
ncbi:hypothetical protein DM793_12920 [Paenarthrobacter nitroguajacolicus]|uniref:YobI family P-loop NTPase n=1 Tax=Paenarthrobacter nitroguajacolicus TaxID=211146 RepID=UPI0015BF84B6|nr:hypothetical protein [Paenarthrobacter nitroguajacolicus]NWL12184.1 hypothetical protein [Paenarthrobacter nitroguajacolicus]